MFEQAANRQAFFRGLSSRWMTTGHNVVWVHSRELCGVTVWGRPGPAETAEMLAVFDGFPHMAPQFDMVLDATAVEGLDQDAVALVLDWLRSNQVVFDRHVRRRVGVIRPGVMGLALSGLTTASGIQAPVLVTSDPREGFRAISPELGDALHDEVAAIVARCRGVPPQLLALRRALAETHGALGLADAAKQLGVSARSMQRLLAEAGSSFRAEQADARFRAASELLESDDKLATVAARLGLSEDGLTLLVRGRTGLTPAELRKKLRGG